MSLSDLVAAAAASIGGPPTDPDAVPEEARLSDDGTLLTLRLARGRVVRIEAGALRLACRCAWCTRARIDGRFPASCDGVAVTALNPVGRYALNIGFSDGHARGLYPFTYLRALAGDGDAAPSGTRP